jgi:hypothetical protein
VSSGAYSQGIIWLGDLEFGIEVRCHFLIVVLTSIDEDFVMPFPDLFG